MSPTLDLNELWRAAAVLEVLILFACGLYLHLGYKKHVPRHVWWAGVAFGVYLAAIAVGLVANWLSPYPPTPGAKIAAVVGGCCSLVVMWAVWRSIRGHRSQSSTLDG